MSRQNEITKMTFKGRKVRVSWKVRRRKIRGNRNMDETMEGIIKTRGN